MTLIPKNIEEEKGDEEEKNIDSKDVVIDVLDKIMKSVAPHLRRRLNQIVSNSREDEVVALYRIYRLLEFYGMMTLEKQLLSETGPITLAITESAENAKQQFEEVLDNLGDKLSTSPPSVMSDLSPPSVLRDVVDKMSKILKTHSTSPSRGLEHEEREKAFLPTLTKFIQPLLRMCLLSARTLNSGGETSIYMINCASTIQSALKSYVVVERISNRITQFKQLARVGVRTQIRFCITLDE